jgi:hypothetical protein
MDRLGGPPEGVGNTSVTIGESRKPPPATATTDKTEISPLGMGGHEPGHELLEADVEGESAANAVPLA